MSKIIQLLTFIWYSMTTDLYTQYRSYIKQQLMNKSNSELQIIHELLVSDFESRYMFIWGNYIFRCYFGPYSKYRIKFGNRSPEGRC